MPGRDVAGADFVPGGGVEEGSQRAGRSKRTADTAGGRLEGAWGDAADRSHRIERHREADTIVAVVPGSMIVQIQCVPLAIEGEAAVEAGAGDRKAAGRGHEHRPGDKLHALEELHSGPAVDLGNFAQDIARALAESPSHRSRQLLAAGPRAVADRLHAEPAGEQRQDPGRACVHEERRPQIHDLVAVLAQRLREDGEQATVGRKLVPECRCRLLVRAAIQGRQQLVQAFEYRRPVLGESRRCRISRH